MHAVIFIVVTKQSKLGYTELFFVEPGTKNIQSILS